MRQQHSPASCISSRLGKERRRSASSRVCRLHIRQPAFGARCVKPRRCRHVEKKDRAALLSERWIVVRVAPAPQAVAGS